MTKIASPERHSIDGEFPTATSTYLHATVFTADFLSCLWIIFLEN